MFTEKNLLLAAAALGALATPALAQDSTQAATFDGVYVGGAVGYSTRSGDGTNTVSFDNARNGSFGDTVTTSTGANAFSPGFCNGGSTLNSQVTTPCTRDDDGIEYAARIGVDKRFGSIVGGILIEGNKSEASESTTAFSSTPAGYSFRRGIDYAVSARARLGISPGDGRGLIYATGGGSYARIDHDFSTTNTANSFTPNDDRKMVFGFQAGGGAELMLTKNISIGMEYLYNRYNDDDYSVSIGTGTAGATNPFVLAGGVNARPSDTSYDFHTFRATVGLHF